MIVVEKNRNKKFDSFKYAITYKGINFLVRLQEQEGARVDYLIDKSDFNYIVDLVWVIVKLDRNEVVMETHVSANEYFLEDAIKYAWESNIYK